MWNMKRTFACRCVFFTSSSSARLSALPDEPGGIAGIELKNDRTHRFRKTVCPLHGEAVGEVSRWFDDPVAGDPWQEIGRREVREVERSISGGKTTISC